ncbi:unnamed protein product [Owenia fusiformis]|uniref:Uncharacterized protein n=1 Tax=Owenia fusiformis TaxID=6347 RepID=A0A8S4PLB5_OWEFU|nr:unnamed protein product [Owenia fusiformis]
MTGTGMSWQKQLIYLSLPAIVFLLVGAGLLIWQVTSPNGEKEALVVGIVMFAMTLFQIAAMVWCYRAKRKLDDKDFDKVRAMENSNFELKEKCVENNLQNHVDTTDA